MDIPETAPSSLPDSDSPPDLQLSDDRISIQDKAVVTGDQTEAVRLKATIARLEKEKQGLAKLVLEAQKQDAVGRLARGVVHDFSNTMTTISGYTGLCIERAKKEDSRCYFLKKILEVSKEAIATIRQINLFGRNATTGFAPLDCATVIAEILPLLSKSIDDTVSIEKHLAPGLRPISGNREMIEQAIVNLILNAVRSMPGGGMLTITTANVTIDDDFCKTVTVATPGPAVMISVADTGLCEKTLPLPALFDPCEAVKLAGKGLELPVTCLIVKQHKGWMTAKCGIEKGTEIRVYLPAEE